jgi:hypothetical protein
LNFITGHWTGLAASVLAISAVACGSEPTATPAVVIPNMAPEGLAARGQSTTSTIAIEDALSRILPGLDDATASALKGPLTAVQAALKQRDGAALQGAIALARETLDGPAGAKEEQASDLAAIALALDASAASK